MRLSGGLNNYQQTSFGWGYIGLSGLVVAFAKCLLVNSTYGF